METVSFRQLSCGKREQRWPFDDIISRFFRAAPVSERAIKNGRVLLLRVAQCDLPLSLTLSLSFSFSRKIKSKEGKERNIEYTMMYIVDALEHTEDEGSHAAGRFRGGGRFTGPRRQGWPVDERPQESVGGRGEHLLRGPPRSWLGLGGAQRGGEQVSQLRDLKVERPAGDLSPPVPSSPWRRERDISLSFSLPVVRVCPSILARSNRKNQAWDEDG